MPRYLWPLVCLALIAIPPSASAGGNHLASGPFCSDLYLLARPHRDFALYDVAVIYTVEYNDF
jgi:hypothetical protein